MYDKDVLPIIILFHPDDTLLSRLLVSLQGQSKDICIVDNTPTTVKHSVLTFCDKLLLNPIYFDLGENKGIASAQNIGIQYAIDNKYEHVLLLDQDSELPNGFIEKLKSNELKLINDGHKVAAVGPAFKDEKTGEVADAIQQKSVKVNRIKIDVNSNQPVQCDYIIASGSLIRTSVLQEVGFMDDDLFIDWVDIEWGERCSYYGFKSYMVPSVVMNHSIGDEYVSVFGRKINLHSDFRNYFIVRNATHLLKSKKIRPELKFTFLIKIPQYIFFYSLFSKRKIYSFVLLNRAVWDGLIGKLGKGFFV